eukprot:scaffold467_cov403-Prasinococcus_capsulatus_cf.AAC.10
MSGNSLCMSRYGPSSPLGARRPGARPPGVEYSSFAWRDPRYGHIPCHGHHGTRVRRGPSLWLARFDGGYGGIETCPVSGWLLPMMADCTAEHLSVPVSGWNLALLVACPACLGDPHGGHLPRWVNAYAAIGKHSRRRKRAIL